MGSDSSLTYGALLNKAWPIILANAAIPLLGLVDTAVIGHYGSTAELAGLAVASVVFNLIFWLLGFLRMGTTGFIAQADGAQNQNRMMQILLQSLLFALLLSVLLLCFQSPLLALSHWLLQPPSSVAPHLDAYFYIRIWGAPVALINFVALGYFIGRAQSKTILVLQLFLNISNALFDYIFAGILDWGLEGIAFGTLLAQLLCALISLVLISKQLPLLSYLIQNPLAKIMHGCMALLVQNRELFIRTLFLLMGFTFFTRIAGSFGELNLAANHILLQFIAFSAFFSGRFCPCT